MGACKECNHPAFACEACRREVRCRHPHRNWGMGSGRNNNSVRPLSTRSLPHLDGMRLNACYTPTCCVVSPTSTRKCKFHETWTYHPLYPGPRFPLPAELRARHRCPYAPSPCPSERKLSHHPSPEETHAAHACSLHPNNWPLGWRSSHAECSGDGSACHLLWGRNTHSPIPSMYPDQLRGSRSTKSNTRPRSILSSTKADENPRRVILAVIMTPFCLLIAARVAVLFAQVNSAFFGGALVKRAPASRCFCRLPFGWHASGCSLSEHFTQ
jgi:hypothetical protein